MKTPSFDAQFAELSPRHGHLTELAAAAAKYGAGGITHRAGLRTWHAHLGLIRGLPPAGRLVTVADRPQGWWTQALAEMGTRFRPRTAPADCDLLVLEGLDPGTELHRVLAEEGLKAKKACAVVGVESDRAYKAAALGAVRDFLQVNPTWVVSAYAEAGAGVVVLSRDATDLQPIRHGVRDVFAFFSAELGRRVKSGGTYLPLPMARERIDACLTCTTRGGETGAQCRACGCYLFQVPDGTPLAAGTPGKVFFPNQACPLGKWEAVASGGEKMTPAQVGEMLAAAFSPATPAATACSPPETPG